MKQELLIDCLKLMAASRNATNIESAVLRCVIRQMKYTRDLVDKLVAEVDSARSFDNSHFSLPGEDGKYATVDWPKLEVIVTLLRAVAGDEFIGGDAVEASVKGDFSAD